MKAIEQYFFVVLFFMMYKVHEVLRFFKCWHSNENSLAVNFKWYCIFCKRGLFKDLATLGSEGLNFDGVIYFQS